MERPDRECFKMQWDEWLREMEFSIASQSSRTAAELAFNAGWYAALDAATTGKRKAKDDSAGTST